MQSNALFLHKTYNKSERDVELPKYISNENSQNLSIQIQWADITKT